MNKTARKIVRWGRIFPALFLFQGVACLPDNAIREVLAENIVRTSGVVIQSVVAILFGTFFPFL
ncbi:MAG: hypothetical protein O7B26_08660 [Planctomycetota bacterium]|nr:hypothetical protein [Planctomycetota bacterium]